MRSFGRLLSTVKRSVLGGLNVVGKIASAAVFGATKKPGTRSGCGRANNAKVRVRVVKYDINWRNSFVRGAAVVKCALTVTAGWAGAELLLSEMAGLAAWFSCGRDLTAVLSSTAAALADA